MTLSRYLLFAGDAYYPSGGWNDFVSASVNLDPLKAKAVELLELGHSYKRGGANWAHIIDTQTDTCYYPKYRFQDHRSPAPKDAEWISVPNNALSRYRDPDQE